jgi:PAS domain S-box-containing protein
MFPPPDPPPDPPRPAPLLAMAETSWRMLSSAVDQAKESILITDAQIDAPGPGIVFVNPAFTRMTGYAASEVIGLTPRILQGPRTDLTVLRRLRHNLERGEEFSGESINYRKDGTEFDMEWQIAPVRDAAGKTTHFVATQRDITERKRLEEQLRQSQKMDALGTLAGGIAHGFNNILASIYGHTELAQLLLPDHPAVDEHLRAVLRASNRARDLVRQILTFSRRQPLERRPLALLPVVAEALQLLRATIPSTVEFDVALAADAPTVLANETQVEQVLLNLGTNAWQAMKDGAGRLQVRLERQEVDGGLAAREARLRPGPYACISVRDNGRGMDPATLRRIFEPFFTTRSPGQGTGLGLALVHGIMEDHGGAITVRSRPGEGTVFQAYFPACASAPAPTPAENSDRPSGQGEMVLVVDDDASLAELCRKTLAWLGYGALAVADPAAALALVRGEPRRFALVIADQSMPGLTGLQLAVELRLVRPDLPVLLLTGNNAGVAPDQAEAAGIRQVLLRPVTVQALATAIRAALGAAGRA